MLRYVVAIGTLLLLDAFWLFGLGTAKAFSTMASSMSRIIPWKGWQLAFFTASAYILLSTALCVFAVKEKHPLTAMRQGALLGLIIYGVYDFTNLAVFGKAYGIKLATADLCWGTFVMGTSALAGSLVM